MLLSRGPAHTFSAYIFQSAGAPVWMKSNLCCIPRRQRQTRESVCVCVCRWCWRALAAPCCCCCCCCRVSWWLHTHAWVVLTVDVSACYSHADTPHVSWPTSPLCNTWPQLKCFRRGAGELGRGVCARWGRWRRLLNLVQRAACPTHVFGFVKWDEAEGYDDLGARGNRRVFWGCRRRKPQQDGFKSQWSFFVVNLFWDFFWLLLPFWYKTKVVTQQQLYCHGLEPQMMKIVGGFLQRLSWNLNITSRMWEHGNELRVAAAQEVGGSNLLWQGKKDDSGATAWAHWDEQPVVSVDRLRAHDSLFFKVQPLQCRDWYRSRCWQAASGALVPSRECWWWEALTCGRFESWVKNMQS